MSTDQKTIKVVMIGDLVGRPGRALFATLIDRIKAEYTPDCIIVNGENAAQNGRGITAPIVEHLLAVGANIITSGNHVFAQKGYTAAFMGAGDGKMLRPLNFPAECPGRGYAFFTTPKGVTIAVINAQGRVFMHEQVACPFRSIETALTFIKTKTSLVFVDFHAETTSEKQGLAYFFDGKITAQVGTHTHVQTADERVLPKGTAYITDLGCSAAINSMLGMQTNTVLNRMITQLPSKFLVEEAGPFLLQGVCIMADAVTGLAVSIERIQMRVGDVSLGVETAGKE